MIVREPMERLASCYYDKIIINPAKSLILFRNAIKKVISKSQKLRRKYVTFADFLQVIVIGKRGNSTNYGRHWHDCDFDICIQNTKPAFLLYSNIAEVTCFGFHPANHKICKMVSKIN